MRYRLMASYLGASYQAAVGPSDRDVTLFAAPPPPEEHGFSPTPGGVWRKQVKLNDVDALWESRPIGSYHGEPCLVLDDLGDRLHIVYMGMDERRAGQLGYWQVDRGVFEVVVPRQEVSDLAEERHEFPIALLLAALPRALSAGEPARMPTAGPGVAQHAGAGVAAPPPLPVRAGPGQVPGGLPHSPGGPAHSRSGPQPMSPGPQQPGMAQRPSVTALPGTQSPGAPAMPGAAAMPAPPQMPAAQHAPVAPVAPQAPVAQAPAAAAAWHGSPTADANGVWYYQQEGPAAPQQPAQAQAFHPGQAAQAPQAPPVPPVPPAPPAPPLPAVSAGSPPAEPAAAVPLGALPPPSQETMASTGTLPSALSKLTGAVRGRRAARKPRLAMSAVFADLVDMADIPRSAYAVDDEVTGAMCLFKTEGGYEVFSCAEDARHEVRFFEDEEAAYFYLFGVLAAEALRNGRLAPRRG